MRLRLGRRPAVLAGIAITLCVSAAVPVPGVASPGRAVSSARVAAAPGVEGPGPVMVTSRSARRAALTCEGIPGAAGRAPILLVPGTRVHASENWDPSFKPLLLDRGHPVCMVNLPRFGTRDVQANTEYVATAIRTMGAWFRPRISIIGHSQGAFLPRAALRIWPDLHPHVEDVIGIAGVYDHGSQALRNRCRNRCSPVLHQLAAGSALLKNIGKRRLPAGPDYTNIGSLGDRTVTPQPAANHQRGTRSIMIQDLCPGRVVPLSEHAMIVGDNVALALTLDALDHPGTAAPTRVGTQVCETGNYPQFNSVQYLAVAAIAELRAATPVAGGPARYCRHRPTCRNPRLRGPLITRARYTLRPHTIIVRTRALGAGRIDLRLGRQHLQQRVQPGPVTLRIHRPPERKRLKVITRPRYYVAGATEAQRWIPARAR